MKRILTTLSVSDMLKEIKRRKSRVSALHKRRASLLKKLAAIDAEIKAEGGKAGTGAVIGSQRPRNEASLPETMVKVMSKSKSMSVAQIEAAVLKAGYKTTAATFKTIIFQTLARDDRFKKKARGQYTLS